jgi:hypothetical protein
MTSKSMMDRSSRIEFKKWEAKNQKNFVRPSLEQQIDTRGVPEENRDAEFERELVQLRLQLYRDSTSYRWLFRLAIHEGAHQWRMGKTGRECTMAGPRIEYRNERFHIAFGAIWVTSKVEHTYEYIMDTIKGHLAGPLAVSMLTGVKEDAESDILAACEFLEMSNEKAKWFVWVAEIELQEEMRKPEVVQEILNAARKYANTIFRNDFCIEWGVKKFGLRAAVSAAVEV